MVSDRGQAELFENGSAWMRADFHLHTKADKEFKFSDDDNYYVSNFVDSLVSAEIRVGVITNHNKFDFGEFKALRNHSKKSGICLLPGVELSVNDGANGVHVLVVFNAQWLENGTDYISPFITSMFPGKAEVEYQNENGRSDKNVLQLVEELDKTGRDYFLIFAHVEQKSGLWYEMSGGKLSDFSGKRYDLTRKRTLGFQKVRTRDDRKKVEAWLQGWYPAEVEGSDSKSIEEIGKGRKGYIKVGAFSFDAVKYALIDRVSRVKSDLYIHKHSHIKSIKFEGGTLSGQQLHFSPELNTIIGIRGSGKSSILEVIRYGLEIPFGEKSGDTDYKQDLVGFTLGSGGKVEITCVDRYGQPYVLRRVWKETQSEVLIGEVPQPGVSIRETIIHKPIYFGQKDLSSTSDGFEKDLVDKLLGSKLDEVRRKIGVQRGLVVDAIGRLKKSSSIDDLIAEEKKIIQDTKHQLKFYKDHDIEEKLQKRLDFESDTRAMNLGVSITEKFLEDLEDLFDQHKEPVTNFKGHVSKHNPKLFESFYSDYKSVLDTLNQVKAGIKSIEKTKKALLKWQGELKTVRSGLVEEFAEIERKLAEELKAEGSPNISSEEFLRLTSKLKTSKQMLAELKLQKSKRTTHEISLASELQKLNGFWHKEFQIVQKELDKVGTGDSPLTILSGYKEDKQAFLTYMKDCFRGSGIRETTYKGIADNYQDFAGIYTDFQNAKEYFGTNPQILIDLFLKDLERLLPYQTPNKFTIKYRGKELQHHSLGQRASALIIFVLSQKDNDVIIIDQPEDDLDNQTIYEDVIKLIRQMKPNVQFIFATHNANIPVLGDAELVQSCSFEDDEVAVHTGSVDNAQIQKTIVNIMEGGEEAFNRRKEIYQIWKP